MLLSLRYTIFEADLVSYFHTKARDKILTNDATGVAADIGHINTNSVVKGYDPTPEGLKDCLGGTEIVLIPAGVPRKPGMTRDGKRHKQYRARLVTDIYKIFSTPMPLSSETLRKQPLSQLPTLIFLLSRTRCVAS